MIRDQGPLGYTASSEALAGRRVLLYLGKAELRGSVSMLLAFRGAEVRAVSTLEEALFSRDPFDPDVVIAEVGSRAILLADEFAARQHRPVYAVALADVMTLLGQTPGQA